MTRSCTALLELIPFFIEIEFYGIFIFRDALARIRGRAYKIIQEKLAIYLLLVPQLRTSGYYHFAQAFYPALLTRRSWSHSLITFTDTVTLVSITRIGTTIS